MCLKVLTKREETGSYSVSSKDKKTSDTVTMRFFPNRMADFVPGARVQVDHEFFKHAISEAMNTIVQKMPPTFDNCDGGLYVGCAGLAYMFYYVANTDYFADKRGEYLAKARNYMDVALSYASSRRNSDHRYMASFLLGGGGVYTVGSMVYSDIGEKAKSAELNKKYEALASVCQPISYLDHGSDELFVGRAGYLCGALLLNRKFGQVVPKEMMHKVCHSIIHSGRQYAKRHNSGSPLMYAYYDTEYLGAAHGLSSILQMLMCCPEFLKSDPSIEADVHQAVDFMLGLMAPDGNTPTAMDEVGSHRRRPQSEELVHWCHGGPGIVYMFARAFLLWKDDKYLQACLKCGELAWQKGLLKKGPGICHGVTGSGYVHLLLYRLTSDERHLHRAHMTASFLFSDEFKQGARTPDSPYSLYEGSAGAVCFLVDLLQPNKAEFPFFDVFSY